MEEKMFAKGDEFRQQNKMTDELCLKMEEIKLSNNTTEMTEKDKRIEKGGDIGQVNKMTDAKQQKNKK
jgi:hypothetical protein